MAEKAKNKNLTSPGIILILAILSSGGIFLLDRFALRPHITAQESSALRQRAVRTEQAAREVMAAQQLALREAVLALACSEQAQRLAASGAGQDEFARFASASLGQSSVDLAWICDSSGGRIKWWSSVEHVEGATAVTKAMAEAGELKGPHEDKLLKIGNEVAIVARQAIGPQSGSAAGMHLHLARYIDGELLHRLGSAVGGNVVLVATGELPEGMAGDLIDSQALWAADENSLSVAWRLQDAAGRKFGYLQANVPVTQIRRQAGMARTTIQIILALSVGLCVLVIVGTHILISGPVIRLLRKIQRIDTGSGTVDELTQNLHGEPLVLARRLETAFNQLASLSKTEQLTGMANRRHFEQVLNAFYYQARRYNRPLSVILLDIDFFKAVNDAGGHKAGDDLLKQVAEAIEKVCRKADLPARLGGDEFAVLLPETPALNAAEMAERIRTEVAKLSVPIRGTSANVTVSLGITDLNSGEIDSPDAMMLLADKAMYAAKDRGRNRYCQAHELDENFGADASRRAKHLDILQRKVIGLDEQFKKIFVQGLEEIMDILAQRDPHMADHAEKVHRYATLIAREMGLPDRVLERLQNAALLHDIGMLAMPDTVLLCEGALGDEQVKSLRRHPLLAVRIMEGMEFLEQEIPSVRYHHERFDGSGYPEGLVGSAIPLTARILAVADAFDAMTSPRTFRGAKTVSEALAELRASSGSQFDPAVVEAMVAIAEKLGDALLTTATCDDGAQKATAPTPQMS